MTFKPLVIDTAQTRATGLYTLYTPDGKCAFTLHNAEDVHVFTRTWFENRPWAVECYNRMVLDLERAALWNRWEEPRDIEIKLERIRNWITSAGPDDDGPRAA